MISINCASFATGFSFLCGMLFVFAAVLYYGNISGLITIKSCWHDWEPTDVYFTYKCRKCGETEYLGP